MVYVHGSLHKKCLILWKERYFVLKGTTLSQFKKKGDNEPKRAMTVGSGWSVQRSPKAGDGFVLTAPGRVTKLRASSEQEEGEWVTALETIIKNEKERLSKVPLRKNTKLWWAETKQGQFCFELDNHYEMNKTIGSGGYGVVVSALNKKDTTKVAVKKVVSAFDDMLVAKRMIREIRLLRQFDHDNIIRIVDMMPPPSVDKFRDVYMVLDRMDTDLHHIIYSGQNLKEAHLQFFLYQILCGLHYMHSARVIHRDLKPANVLVNTTCDLKLCDFGLARSLGKAPTAGVSPGGGGGSSGDAGGDGDVAPDVEDGDSGGEVKLTEYVVTRWWRAPEVFLEAHYGTAIDVWSAGCIMAEMLQRKPLFMGSNTAQMLRLVVQFTGKPSEADLTFVTNKKARNYVLDMTEGPRTALTERFPDASSDALDLLAKMLTFDPARRISVRDAMRHPWLSRFYQVEHETPAPKPAELTAVENLHLTRPNLQQLMFEDVCAFRPECRAMALGGGGADPSPASTEFSDISINSPALGGPGGAAAAAAVVAAASSGAVGKQQVAGGGSGRDISGGLEVIGETKGCAASVSVVAVEAGASTASVAT
ncbi:unnamed protein product [Pylaiella littoralis]